MGFGGAAMRVATRDMALRRFSAKLEALVAVDGGCAFCECVCCCNFSSSEDDAVELAAWIPPMVCFMCAFANLLRLSALDSGTPEEAEDGLLAERVLSILSLLLVLLASTLGVGEGDEDMSFKRLLRLILSAKLLDRRLDMVGFSNNYSLPH